MLTAKVVDNIWSTRKTDLLNGYKLMLVEVLGGRDDGQRVVAVDTVGAGVGERVLVALGSSARRMVGDDAIPTDAAVVGIIDEDCEF
jgi:ethanolamine utilization protein EutN